MFLILLRALPLLYTPCVLLGSFAVFCDQYMFLYPSKKKKKKKEEEEEEGEARVERER